MGRNPRRIDSNLFRIIFSSPRGKERRLILVAPRSLDKRAVIRNRLRRRVREWLRKRRPEILKTSPSILIFFKKEAATVSRRKFYAELAKIFE